MLLAMPYFTIHHFPLVMTAALGLALPLAGYAQKSHLTTPTTISSSPAAAWIPFQLDEHLLMQLPAPPRLLTIPALENLPAAVYGAENATSLCLIMRVKLSDKAVIPGTETGPETLYTSLTQSMLTTLKAARTSQAAFHAGKFEGLELGFRIKNPSKDQPAGGTMWALRVGQGVYLLQYWPKDPANPENAAQQARFVASLEANDTPYSPPTEASWAKFRTGRFRYLDPEHSAAVVERTDTTQIEVDAAKGLRLVYGLKWTSEGYEITQRASTSRNAGFLQGKTIRVRITAVEGETYSYWSTLEGFIFTGKIQKLK